MEYERPKFGLHFCPLDPFCRKIGAETKDEFGPGTGGVMPWLYIHLPWGSLIIPFTFNRENWPYGGWWLRHKKR